MEGWTLNYATGPVSLVLVLWQPASLTAAIGYYRAATAGAAPDDAVPYALEEQAAWRRAERPTLYLHGTADGCIQADLAAGAARLLYPGSRLLLIEDAGHFLHLERPAEINEQILAWVTG